MVSLMFLGMEIVEWGKYDCIDWSSEFWSALSEKHSKVHTDSTIMRPRTWQRQAKHLNCYIHAWYRYRTATTPQKTSIYRMGDFFRGPKQLHPQRFHQHLFHYNHTGSVTRTLEYSSQRKINQCPVCKSSIVHRCDALFEVDQLCIH